MLLDNSKRNSKVNDCTDKLGFVFLNMLCGSILVNRFVYVKEPIVSSFSCRQHSSVLGCKQSLFRLELFCVAILIVNFLKTKVIDDVS